MLEFIHSYHEQHYHFLKEILAKTKITFSTLGPKGTSSVNALEYFLYHLKAFDNTLDYDLALYNTFDEVYKNLQKGTVTYALVPSAYGRITEFFWDSKLVHCFQFVYPTPNYGLAARENTNLSHKRTLVIAGCTPVLHLIPEFLPPNQNISFQILVTPSTTKALEKVLAGKADLALTNETSLEKHHAADLKFITEKRNANIVWSLFGLKDETENILSCKGELSYV